jgi:hypothetical protein
VRDTFCTSCICAPWCPGLHLKLGFRELLAHDIQFGQLRVSGRVVHLARVESLYVSGDDVRVFVFDLIGLPSRSLTRSALRVVKKKGDLDRTLSGTRNVREFPDKISTVSPTILPRVSHLFAVVVKRSTLKGKRRKQPICCTR